MSSFFRSRRSSAVGFIVVAIMLLIFAISTSVQLNSDLADYHTLTSDNIKSVKMCTGTIDVFSEPCAYSEDGADICFLLLDNDQLIAFKTKDEEQLSTMLAFDDSSDDNKLVEFVGRVKKLKSVDRSVLLGIIVDEGYPRSAAEKLLVPYYIENYNPNTNKYMYMGAIVFMGIGILMFLPEFSSFVGKTGKKTEDYYTPTSNRGYQSTYPGASYKSYTGTQGNIYGNSAAQTYGQNTTGAGQNNQQQNISQGQNRGYAGANYSGQYSGTQGQNRNFTGTDYSGQYSGTQGQNRNFTGADYSGQYSGAQGQNRNFTGADYSGQYSNTQGQNRGYTADTANAQNQPQTSDKPEDKITGWNNADTENKDSLW